MLGEPPKHWPQESCGDEPGRLAFLASSKTRVAAVDDLVAVVVQPEDTEELCAGGKCALFDVAHKPLEFRAWLATCRQRERQQRACRPAASRIGALQPAADKVG